VSAPDVPLQAFNDAAAAFLQIHRHRPTPPYVGNLRTEVDAIETGGVRFPVTVNDAEADNAWICSPTTTYGRYAQEEILRLGRPWLTAPLRGLAGAAGWVLKRSRIDRAVAINNWLVSTNVYPALRDIALDRVIAEARERWPAHALWFRSLNVVHHAEWLHALRQRGFVLVPSRQVYLFDQVADLARRRTDLKRDLALRARAEQAGRMLRLSGDDEFDLAARLYAALYVDKYSACNPVYSGQLMRAWHEAGLLELTGLRDEQGALAGVVGMVRMGQLITSPIVGYDISLPRSAALYRLLSATVLHRAIEQGCAVNLSAGVAHFKRQRGGKPAIEYSAVLVEHMPRRTRAAVVGLGAVSRTVGIPVVRRFRL